MLSSKQVSRKHAGMNHFSFVFSLFSFRSNTFGQRRQLRNKIAMRNILAPSLHTTAKMLEITIGDSICAQIVSKLFDFRMYLHSFSWCSYGYARFTHAVCFVFQLDCLNFPCACLDFLWFCLVLFYFSWYIFHRFLCLEPSECHRNFNKLSFFNN